MAMLQIFKTVLTVGSALWTILVGPQVPKLEDVYWGPGEPPKSADTSINPFNIEFSSDMVDDLLNRLNNTRALQPTLENAGWKYGMNRELVPYIADYWLNDYDFDAAQERFNRHPQFVTNIQGLDMYYIHVKPQLPQGSTIKVLPIMLLHGWPGSVVEFHKVIPLLTTPRADRHFVFEVIVPSMPGFGYSEAPSKMGLTAADTAHLLRNLMLRIGFTKWYTQGGDWGAVVTAYMAALYPENTLGMHSNFCLSTSPKSLAKFGLFSLFPWMALPEERRLMQPAYKAVLTLLQESGYLHEQATKPDTLGVSLSDSPVGLSTWILDLFFTNVMPEIGSPTPENLTKKFTMDELIDNLMLYWAPNKFTSSVRTYAETINVQELGKNLDGIQIKVPSACAQFPYDILFMPEKVLKDRFVNLVHRTIMPRGGHFAALEEPQLLADDVFLAVSKML